MPHTRTVPGSSDPVFAAMARERAAGAALYRVDEFTDPAGYAAASDEFDAAVKALIAARPTTLAGCRALIAYRLAEEGEEVEEAGTWSSTHVLMVVGEALANLSAFRSASP
jgi:hypothetical protein